MSYYYLSEGEDSSVGVDLDQMVYPEGKTFSQLESEGDKPSESSYGDYEILKQPQLSGGSYVVPSQQEMGIPKQYKTKSTPSCKVILNLVMFEFVILNGSYFFLFINKGITDPLLPITFPYLTTEKLIFFFPLMLLAAINNFSEQSFVAP